MGKSNSRVKKISTREYLQHARMLVPKFGYEQKGIWYIHWPKDQPFVVHAKTQKELVVVLASWLQELGRVKNVGVHVEPELP